jgi:hypothetical protein
MPDDLSTWTFERLDSSEEEYRVTLVVREKEVNKNASVFEFLEPKMDNNLEHVFCVTRREQELIQNGKAVIQVAIDYANIGPSFSLEVFKSMKMKDLLALTDGDATFYVRVKKLSEAKKIKMW